MIKTNQLPLMMLPHLQVGEFGGFVNLATKNGKGILTT